jgi:hypothetical protein
MNKGTLRIIGRNLQAVRTIGGGTVLEVGDKMEELANEVRTIVNGDAEVSQPTIEWCRNGILAGVYIRCPGDSTAISSRFKGWRVS